MRSNVYLFATAILAATSAPALSTEMAISDTPVIVYDATPYDAAYAAPSGDGYIPAEGIIYTDDTAPAEMLSTDIIAIEAPAIELEYVTAATDIPAYASEQVETIHADDHIADTPVSVTETIDGIVYETVIDPSQTY